MTASSQPRAFSQTIASVTGDAGDSRYGDTRRRKTLHAISITNTLHAISSTNTSNRSRSDSSSSSMSSSAGTRVYRACAHKVSCTCGDTGEADWARLGGKCACQCKCVGECDSAHRPLLHEKATEKIHDFIGRPDADSLPLMVRSWLSCTRIGIVLLLPLVLLESLLQL